MGTIALFGGSGRIGQAIVRKLASRHRIRFTYWSQEDQSKALARSLCEDGADVEADQVDIRDAQAVDSFLARSESIDGHLSGVLCATGSLFAVYPFQEAEFAEFRRVMELDVYGSFHIMQSAARRMALTGGGPIVVLLTAAILRTAAYDGMSSIPKMAVGGMIRQLARDAGAMNIRCNGIAPGVVDTDKVDEIPNLPKYKRTLVENFMQDTVLRRYVDPNNIASLALWLLSDDATDISGQIIGADAGYSA
ncbi:SDR family NAD(P)-dependent oxidoreductase [Sphingomonas tabacisoli]|uniref:SDR family NAD(P)-dependent oxidoreductase n=1 Tax=Sphingomonas tabacisoli TaxID=2249466 RepID=A0ABW4I0N2_9SPHN